MANKDDYLTYYREFFENFAQSINPNDQLPVKLGSYKLVNVEVVGGIIDWTTQYLTQKKCPPCLIAPLIKIIIEEIRKICKKQPLSCGFIPSDNAYEPLKLMQTVMAKTNEVCLRYLDNSQLCSLPSPGSPTFITSVYAVKNTRRRMEDRHVVIHDLNTMFNIQEASPSSYYAVFDGHAGHDAAAYSSAHLHQFLAENKYFISNPEQALLDAFCKTDALFIDKCKVENLSSGTTAVVALLRPKEKTLYIAWAGDSQALLVNQGKILQVVNPHKPSRKDEKERIERNGGCVLMWGTWRVNGQLAVSRAIGDAEYKPHVIAIPDVREIPLDGGEDFLILACDGLWDFVSEDSAARFVYKLVTENPDDTDRISQHLVQLSKDQGSSDNISVIVVFLREPSKIAAEAHWANRNCTPVTMDTSLDNANNPFSISNGASNDNIISQKSDGLLLNLTDNFKHNGTEVSPTADFYGKEKSNGKRTASEFEDDDFGPETDVDAVDEALSPAEIAKGFGDVFSNNNPSEGVYNPFMEHQEKAVLDVERELQKQESGEHEERRLAREETPTPPADAVHDVSGLVDNTADSESEDEWNYFKGDEANKENISPQPDREDRNITPTDLMENLLNGKNIDEIPEFQPGSTPKKNAPSEEFHFGPNAAPFTPAKFLDQSEAALSTKAVYGDESTATLGISFNESQISQDINLANKESDPMSMSFYADKGDTNPFDLNEVHMLPDNIDEFLNKPDKPDNSLFNDTISDLPEHHPLGDNWNTNQSLNNDDAILTTDLDKRSSYEDEKELASPLEPEKELSEADRLLLGGGEPCDQSNTPEPSHENLLGNEFCHNFEESKMNEIGSLPRDVELISPEPTDKRSESASPRPAFYSEEIPKSPLREATEVEDLLRTQPDTLPPDVELIPSQLSSTSPSLTHDEVTKSPQPQESEIADLLQSKSPLPGASEVSDLLGQPEIVQSQSPLHEAIEINKLLHAERQSSDIESHLHEEIEDVGLKSPLHDLPDSTTKTADLSKSPLPEVCELPLSKTPTSDIHEAKSPVSERSGVNSPFCELPESKSPVDQLTDLDSPVCELPVLRSPVCGFREAKSPVCDIVETNNAESDAKSPIPEYTKDTCDFTKPDDIEQAQLHFGEISTFENNISKVGEDFIKDEVIKQAQEHFEEICRPTENVDLPVSPQDDITTSLKDELSSPAASPLPGQIEDSFVADQSTLISGIAQDIAGVVQKSIVDTPLTTSCPISPSKSIADTESVATTDVNSFLDRSLPPDVASPLSSTQQELDIMDQISGQLIEHPIDQATQFMFDTNQALFRCVYPLPTEAGEQIEIKTENITPEYAEQALVTPSEESKQDDVPTAPPLEEPVVAENKEKEDTEIGPVEGIAAVAAVGAVAAVAAVTSKVEKEEKKKPSASSAKRLPGAKTTTSKASTRTVAAAPAPKVASRLSASPRPAPAKTGTAKPTTISAPKPATTLKPSPRPRPTTAPKSIEKKPLANGDVKPSVRSTLTSKKTTETTLAKTSTPRPATAGATKLSPTKAATPRPNLTPRPATTSRVTTTRTTTTTASAAPPKPRPTTLANKAPTGTASKTSTALKSPPSKITPKVAPAPRTKPPTALLSKPRIPLTKTVSKAPDTEKQNKESANKLTASRTLTSTTRTASATARSTSTTVRKIESKTMGTRTMKTTTTTTKSTTARKPAEIVRNMNSSKTKTTKIEKPKENGISTVVTEEITTVVNNTTNSVIDSEPQLLKDNSPVDNNKLIIENTLIQPNTAD